MHTFLKGILYFFSLNENPIEEYDRRRKEKNDLERMRSDWYNVGNDIRRAYENTNQQKEPAKVQISHERHYSGPLPLPEDLAKYDHIVPGAAERILKMAEKEMDHRHAEDSKLSKGIILTAKISIIFAFICVLILSGLSFYAIHLGHAAVGGSIAVGAIAAVAGAFLYKSKRTKIQYSI